LIAAEGDTGLPDIVYDSNSGLWKCCGIGSGIRSCQQPTNESFLAPAPSDLIEFWPVSATAISTAASTSPSTTKATPSSTAPAASKSSGLSTGAKAGIGVGVTIVGLILIVSGIFLILRRKRVKQWINEDKRGSAELSGLQKPLELPTQGNISSASATYELPAT
jgi:hypothetical protein